MNERLPYLREKTSKLTTSPGVYKMKNALGHIIYIGKAKNLKNRVTSYFRESADHTPKVAKMVENVYDYDFIVTDTEYEALVLECSLIKQHKPKYNILLKDDKGYHYIHVSDEAYPRITTQNQPPASGITLGPYVSPSVTKQTVAEVNKVFMLPVCKKKFPCRTAANKKPCLNYHIKQCMGVCRGKISVSEYSEIISQAVDYIKNGSKESVERLTEEMLCASENLEFEKAAKIRDRIQSIQRAAQTQKIIDADIAFTDIIASVCNYVGTSVSVIVYRNGKLVDKNSYFFEGIAEADNVLEDFMVQYYSGNNDIPKNIFIADDIPDKEILEQLLKEQSGHTVHIMHRQKGNMMKYIMLARNNASEFLSLRAGRTGKELVALEELSKLLGLKNPPVYIEAYDISNLGSSAMCASMVVFENGRPMKKMYKKFSIKNVLIQNDYACMHEVLERRFRRYLDENETDEGFKRRPDLIFLDGGKGQVNAVEPYLREMGIDVPVFGIVKDNKHRTRAISTGGEEISVSSIRNAFALITNIQDEMHRCAITYQKKLHSKITFDSRITQVKGIGEKKAVKLMTRFKTIEALKNADAEEVSKIAGVNIEVAKELLLILNDW
ncbi:MAG: excinuclease ABC subunit UvrC [Oscillospiraceae bacterium]|nr:excinuclease ABC subunit UvrC [Oscillospiraceae bacterium]MBQ9981400.1 excinuclease ABC subunit UvrC [Oscillospiraceae bacterium]